MGKISSGADFERQGCTEREEEGGKEMGLKGELASARTISSRLMGENSMIEHNGHHRLDPLSIVFTIN